MAAPTTEFGSDGSGTITTTGEANGLLQTIKGTIPNARVRVGVSGTFTSVVLAVRGRLRGLNSAIFYPIPGRNLTTSVHIPNSGAISLTNSTNALMEFEATGCDQIEVYVVSGTPTSFTVECRPEAGDPNASPLLVNAMAGASTFAGAVIADNTVLAIGTDSDLTIGWDGTDIDVLQAAANSSIKWGIDGAGIDQVWYGDTASTNMTWDQSADSLIFNGAGRIVFTGTTGQPEIHLTDNLADALSIEISGSTDLLVFTTTNDAESVSPIGLRTRQSTAVAITGATTLKLSDSGGVFTVSQAAAYDIDLPSPTTGPGCRYFFHLTGPAANAVTITVAGGAATFVGSIVSEGQIIVATGSTLTFASGAALLGDSIEIQSLATNLYHVRAIASALNGITVS